MKKTYLTTFSFVLLFPFLLLSQEIEVPQTNQPLITKRTATWCPNCGTYGWTLFRDLLADQQSNALLIAAHFGSSVLANEAGDGVVDILGGFGQPTFFLNTDNLGANSGNIAVVRQDVASTVAQINDTPPVAQTGILAEATDDSLIVHTKTAFFEAVENTSVNLAEYLIEPDVVATQSQQGPMAAHKNIIRYEMSGAAAGQTIADGGAVAGTEVERRYSI